MKKKSVKSKAAPVQKQKRARPMAKQRVAAAKPASEKSKASRLKGTKTMVTKKPDVAVKIAKKKPTKFHGPVRKVVNAGSPLMPKFTPTRRKLTAAEVREFKDVLLKLRSRLTGQIHSLKSDSLMRNDEVNTVEDGTDAFERQFALNLASTEHDVLFEVEDALRRIEAGSFGICELANEPIELERLKAIPYTRYSLAAQAEMEKGKAPYRQASVMKDL